MRAESNRWFPLNNLGRYTDVLRLRGGRTLTMRFLEARDADGLQNYFQSLSQRSRYSRLLGAASGLPPSELDKALHVGEGNRFAVVAEMKVDGIDTIVGEARYSFDPETRETEFGLSIGDGWQEQGIGAAMLANLECRAAALGAERLFGETLRNNTQMIGLARKAGFEFRTASDWRLTRLEKPLHQAADIPCESWKLAAASGWNVASLLAG